MGLLADVGHRDAMRVIELDWIDWAVVAAYGVTTFAIALWAMRHVKDSGGLLLAKRKAGWLMQIAATFAGGTNANHPISVASATFERGMSGVWLSLTWILITPFFWLYPPAVRRLRIVTKVDAMRMRFGPVMAMLFKIAMVITTPLAMAIGIKSAAKVLEVMTGGALMGLSAEAMIVVPSLVYALMGGILAAYMTDIFQGLLIIVLSFLLIPFAIAKAGGIAALDARIDDRLTTLFTDGTAGTFGVWWIIWFAIGVTFSAVLSTGASAASANSEMAARMSTFGLVLKRFCTVGWGLVGLVGIALYAGNELLIKGAGPGTGPDNIFPVASADLLPTALRGLMVASILAAVMSTLTAGILYFGGILVNNIYQEHFVKNASAKHYLVMSRVLSAGGLIVAWGVTGMIDSIVQFTKYVEPLNGLTGISLLIALMWRRITGAGAIAGLVVMGPLFYFTAATAYASVDEMNVVLRTVVESMESFYAWTGASVPIIDNNKLDVPYMYPIFLIPGLLVTILVSVVTPQHDERAVAEFYARLDTPVGQERRIREMGFEADQLEHLDREKIDATPTATNTQRLLLVDWLHLPAMLLRGEVRLSEYKWDLIGLTGSIAFIVGFLWFVNWVGSFF